MPHDKMRAWTKLTKRAPQPRGGLMPSSFVVRLAGESCLRRVFRQFVDADVSLDTRLVVLVNNQHVEVTDAQIEEALAEAQRHLEARLTAPDHLFR